MSAQNNQITAPRVDLIDQNGKISREWYMYLYNLYVITGSGTGITPVINGGTGLGTIPTNGQLLIGNGKGYTLNTLANGAGISITDGSGTILISNTGVLSTIAGTGISVSSATGDVTIANTGVLSVTGTAPVVSSGGANPAISLATAYGDTLNPYAAKTANYVLAGPTTGAAAAPTFRALTTTDIPVLPYGTGTVTSVGMTVPAALLSVAPSTITTTGTFALSLTTQTSAQIFASPISTVGTPSFRSLVTSDIPALNYVSSTTTQAAHQVLAGPITGTSAPTFRSLVSTDIPALPYGTGTVTSVSGTGTVNGITLTGTVTTSGSLTLGGTLGGIGNSQLTNSSITINGTSTSLGGSISVGTVTSVTGTAPVVSSGGVNPAISMPAATTSVSGYLTSTDWNTFNGKQPAGTYVTSVSGTAGRITSTGGTTPAIDLASGVATAGTTGSSTLIPVVTIDTYGRVTTITTASNPQGTVTSVTGTAPVVSSGGTTPAISMAAAYGDTLNPYAAKTANYVLAGPITGTSAPTFRSLVSTDIPALPYGTGSVTSVGLALPSSIFSISNSPVTTTGTLTGTLTTQAANSLFAGPISGVGATPTFRALTTADIAGLGVGTVTSVGMTVPSILSVTPSTITTSGSFALSLTTEPANQIFAGPSSGSAATPTFRSLVSTDIPALPYVTTSAIVTKTADFTLASTENWVINNKSGSTCTVTLPAASSWSGRAVTFKNLQAQTLVSASSNVVPIDSTTAGTAILLASIGNWATIVSDSTNWVIMQAAPNNILLLE